MIEIPQAARRAVVVPAPFNAWKSSPCGWCLPGFILLNCRLAAGRHLPRPADAAYWSDPKWSGPFFSGSFIGAAGLRRMRVPSSRNLAISFIAAFCFSAPDFLGTNLLSPLHHP